MRWIKGYPEGCIRSHSGIHSGTLSTWMSRRFQGDFSILCQQESERMAFIELCSIKDDDAITIIPFLSTTASCFVSKIGQVAYRRAWPACAARGREGSWIWIETCVESNFLRTRMVRELQAPSRHQLNLLLLECRHPLSLELTFGSIFV